MPPSPPTSPPDPRAGLLADLLARAGRAALARRPDVVVRLKADGSAVTDADLAANEVLVEGLARAFPGETLHSEEAAVVAGVPGAPVWWIDPLDGTGAFTEGLAHWGPTVCRAVDGRLDVGAFHEPRLGRQWFAARGGGAWCDGRRLAPAEPGDAPTFRTLYVGSAIHRLPPIPWSGKIRALGCTAAHLALVAAGGAAAAIVPWWEVWDVGCGVLLVEEAGRSVSDLSGGPLDPMTGRGTPLLAAARSVRGDVIDALRVALA